MYNTLVEINKDGDVFLQDNSIALMPKLWAVYKKRSLGSNMVKWIVSVYDYKSPFRRLPLEERKVRASYSVYGKEKNLKEKDEFVLEAIDEYIKLQYDPLIDQYNAMCEQAYEIGKVFRNIKADKDNLEELNKLQKQMQEAATSRDKIKELILKDMESEVKISGTGSDDFSIFEQEERLSRK